MFELEGFFASGDINVSRIVSPVASTQGYVEQATASKVAIGVAQEGDRASTFAGGTAGLAATTGQSLRVYGRGRRALVKAGGTIAANQLLTSDASGQAVSADLTATGTIYLVGRAIGAGSSGDLIEVLVDPQVAKGA